MALQSPVACEAQASPYFFTLLPVLCFSHPHGTQRTQHVLKSAGHVRNIKGSTLFSVCIVQEAKKKTRQRARLSSVSFLCPLLFFPFECRHDRRSSCVCGGALLVLVPQLPSTIHQSNQTLLQELQATGEGVNVRLCRRRRWCGRLGGCGFAAARGRG